MSKPVPVCNDESVERTVIGICKEPPEPASAHIESRVEVGEGQRACLELSVQIAVSLPPVSRKPCIDGDSSLLRRSLIEVQLHPPEKTADLGKGNPSMIA